MLIIVIFSVRPATRGIKQQIPRTIIEIFTPLPEVVYAQRREELEAYRLARQLYCDGDFRAALAAFDDLDKQYDQVLYKIYADRSRELSVQLPKDWDGVWTLTSK